MSGDNQRELLVIALSAPRHSVVAVVRVCRLSREWLAHMSGWLVVVSWISRLSIVSRVEAGTVVRGRDHVVGGATSPAKALCDTRPAEAADDNRYAKNHTDDDQDHHNRCSCSGIA